MIMWSFQSQQSVKPCNTKCLESVWGDLQGQMRSAASDLHRQSAWWIKEASGLARKVILIFIQKIKSKTNKQKFKQILFCEILLNNLLEKSKNKGGR